MRQVLLEKPLTIRSYETPLPEVEPNWVIAKTLCAGICGTDVHSFFGETIFGKVFPFHIGHEICAVVEESGGKALRKGDIIVINPFFSCGVCTQCRMGMDNNCQRRTTIGLKGPGGFSEYVYVPEASAVRVHSDNFAAMSLAEPLSTVIYGWEKLNVSPMKSVLINGVGPIGLMFLQLAFHAGVRQLTVTDLNHEKLKTAQAAGADFALNPTDAKDAAQLRTLSDAGFDIIIDCTGSIQSMQACVDGITFGTQILLFGLCPPSAMMEISPFKLYKEDVSIFTSFALNKSAFCKAVALLENGKINTDMLIDAVLPLSDLEASIRKIAAGAVNGKIIIDTTR